MDGGTFDQKMFPGRREFFIFKKIYGDKFGEFQSAEYVVIPLWSWRPYPSQT